MGIVRLLSASVVVAGCAEAAEPREIFVEPDSAPQLVVKDASGIVGPASYSDAGVVLYSPRAGCFVVLTTTQTGALAYSDSSVRVEYATDDCSGTPYVVLPSLPPAWSRRCFASPRGLFAVSSSAPATISGNSRFGSAGCESGWYSDGNLWFRAEEMHDERFPYLGELEVAYE